LIAAVLKPHSTSGEFHITRSWDQHNQDNQGDQDMQPGDFWNGLDVTCVTSTDGSGTSKVKLSADPRHATKILSSLASMTKWMATIDMLKSMDSQRLSRTSINKYHIGAILNACQKATQWYRSISLLWNPQFSLMASTVSYSSVISSCGSSGQWKQALDALGSMRLSNCKPNLVSFNSAASSYEKHGLWRSASLLQRTQHVVGIQVDTISFNALTSSCEKAAEWEKAFEVLKVMTFSRISNSFISFSAAVSACEKAEQWNWALQVFGERKSRGQGGQFHLHFCNALISACGKGGMWMLVTLLGEQMSWLVIEPDTITFNAALYSYDFLRWRQAMNTFTQMTSAEIRRNDITFNACCTAARYNWLSVLAVLSEMKSVHMQDDALTQSAFVSSCLAEGKAVRLAAVLKDVAATWVSRVRPPKLDAEALKRETKRMARYGTIVGSRVQNRRNI